MAGQYWQSGLVSLWQVQESQGTVWQSGRVKVCHALAWYVLALSGSRGGASHVAYGWGMFRRGSQGRLGLAKVRRGPACSDKARQFRYV